jgi:hypothetical protein
VHQTHAPLASRIPHARRTAIKQKTKAPPARRGETKNGRKTRMQFDAELLLLAMAPLFLACIGWEAWHLQRTRPGARLYSWRDTLCNTALALMHQGADKLAWLFVIPVYAYCYRHWRLVTWPHGWGSLVVLFVAQDLLYYVFHRCSHRVRWLWAAHVVHHLSERMNFSTAFRQSLMYPVAGMWLFWLPLAVLGFAPQLCGRIGDLGSPVRHLRRGRSGRAAGVRHRRTALYVQPAEGDVSRMGVAVCRPGARARLAQQARGRIRAAGVGHGIPRNARWGKPEL